MGQRHLRSGEVHLRPVILLYPLILAIHSLLRWGVLLVGLVAVARGVAGARARRAWAPADERAGFWFVLLMDVQLLLGLALYAWLSPLTALALQDFGAAMGNAVSRFWAVEHALGMLVAIVLVHIGRVRIRRAADSTRSHKLAAIFFGLALLAVLLSIPWPGGATGRPLFRGF